MDPARELNPAQLEAVARTEGPLLVFAGAGSGKTRVITYRIAHILESRGVAPGRVLAVTFTNKAAGEMRERVGRLVGPARGREVWVATFHATGAKLLRRYGERLGLRKDFAIYDDGDQRVVMNRVYDELKISDRDLAPRVVLGVIDRAKQEVLSPDDLAARATTEHERVIARAWAAYEERLHANNAVDFGDLLCRLVRLLEDHPQVRDELQDRFQYLLVDEFQDTNHAQYRILRALVGPARNLCVVGDDDQAIYRWRGADVRNLQYFRRDFPEAAVVKLEQNYRSTQRILQAANAVIAKSHTRESKVLFTHNAEGPLLELLRCEDERDEARQVALRVRGALERGVSAREIAVFYRIHAQSRPLEEGLRMAKVPYVIVGGMRFYERAEVKDLLAYLRLTLNPDDDVSLLRVVNTPPRKIGKTTLDRLQAHAAVRKQTLWQTLREQDYPADVAPAARKALGGFTALVDLLREKAADLAGEPSAVAALLYERTGLQALLLDEADLENEARRENVAELLGSMQDYEREEPEPSVADYLERVTLSESTAEDQGGERVALMTVHSAKGLEFQTVLLTGLEDGMFPYKGTDLGADPEELEEERRLAYVAITRAREQLVLSFAQARQIFGQTRLNGPSRFLLEMPPQVLSSPLTRRFGSVPPRMASREPEEHVPSFADDFDQSVGSTGNWRKGMRVRHKQFGIGRVQSVESGDEPRVTVYFPGRGEEKKLLARFVEPF